MPLTAKQHAFVEAYLTEPNGKAAAIKAGYAKVGAEVSASRLLRHPQVAEEIEKRRRLLVSRSGVTPEMVVAELAKMGFADIRQVMDWHTHTRVLFDESGKPVNLKASTVVLRDAATLPDHVAAAIAEVSQDKNGNLRVKMHDKLAALVRLGQHLGLFTQVPPKEPGDEAPVGKREQAERAAQTAERGTGWDGLLQ